METREPTAEEVEQLGIPTTIVAIDIPVAAFQKAPTLLAKLDLLIKFYDGIERFTNGNTTHLRNIDIKDVEKYVSAEEYQEWKNAWVIFPPEVVALYADKPKDEKPTA